MRETLDSGNDRAVKVRHEYTAPTEKIQQCVSFSSASKTTGKTNPKLRERERSMLGLVEL
jgi:hypothetical protein